jgi:uncharacterized protein
MSDIPVITELSLERLSRGERCRKWLHISGDALGRPLAVPVLAARGNEDGPILGLTAALHGNELNGIAVIQRFFRELDPAKLRGTVVGVPVLNVPGFLTQRRIFSDDADLNRIMPGSIDGGESDVYAHRLLDRLILRLQYLIDFHTASAGRVNTHYIRAEMDRPEAAALARLQNAEIIVHSAGAGGTLRPLLGKRGITCITVELRDPSVFQADVIERALVGLRNTLVHLGMIGGNITPPRTPAVECRRSFWMHTDRGGLLEVLPELGARVKIGEIVARLSDVFGTEIHEYPAVAAGVVIGKGVHVACGTGGRILHLGISTGTSAADSGNPSFAGESST